MTYHERPVDSRPMTADELLDLWLGRPAWMDDGACRSARATAVALEFGYRTATDLFVPPNGRGRRPMTEITAARAICLQLCPVQAECLAYALAKHPQTGTWGGTSFQQRLAMKKEGHTT